MSSATATTAPSTNSTFVDGPQIIYESVDPEIILESNSTPAILYAITALSLVFAIGVLVYTQCYVPNRAARKEKGMKRKEESVSDAPTEAMSERSTRHVKIDVKPSHGDYEDIPDFTQDLRQTNKSFKSKKSSHTSRDSEASGYSLYLPSEAPTCRTVKSKMGRMRESQVTTQTRGSLYFGSMYSDSPKSVASKASARRQSPKAKRESENDPNRTQRVSKLVDKLLDAKDIIQPESEIVYI